MSTTTAAVTGSARQGGAASLRAMPQRPTPVLPVAPRQPFRVLQTSRAPAQLSLFLRPGNSVR